MRIRKYLLGAVLAIGMLAALSGCDLVDTGHTHTFSKWAVTKNATCVDEGVQSRQCQECGYQESERIAALGHTTSKVAAVKATCVTDGLTEGSSCGVCGEVLLAQQVIPAFGHAELKDYAVEPTCTTDGLTEGSHCGLCGAVIVEQTVVPASGHKYDKEIIVSPADCMHAGAKTYICIWCDANYTDIYYTDEHTKVIDQAVAATCTTDGLTEGSHCSVCQLVLEAQRVIPATGHDEVLDVPVAPTCTEPGHTECSHCSRCGEYIIQPTILPALGHQNTELILQEATCQVMGLKELTCQVCGTVSRVPYEMAHFTDMDLYSAAVQYVGEIVTYARDGSVIGGGIGFVLTSDGRIVTNYHVIAGAYSAQITVQNVTYSIISVLAYSEQMDLAVLQVEAANLPVAKICAQPLTDGMTVYALGQARGLTDTYTQGVILTAAREIDGMICVYHDAAITAGNAGGPLLNVYGEIVGINLPAASQDQEGQWAVFISELEKLNYAQPRTMEELYAMTTSAYQQMVDLILATGKKDGLGNIEIYDYNFENSSLTIYTLGYEPASERAYLAIHIKGENGTELIKVKVYLSENVSALSYSFEYTYGTQVHNVVAGYLDGAVYTSQTELMYTSFEGTQGQAEATLFVCQPKMDQALTWLNGYLQSKLGMSIADIGFTAFEG